MLIKNIIESIDAIPDFKEKTSIVKKMHFLEKEVNKLNKKYRKANEDRLTVAHLLSEVNEELEESLNNEKRFIASVSHELRTPLTAILGYTELLNDTALNNKQKRYLDSVTQSSNHLLSLVSDLLDVAKISDNRIELSPKEIDLDDILNDCANLIRSKINKNVEFIVDIPMLEYKIKADDKRVKQIFINLLSNAAKFTQKGSIRFYVKNLEKLKNNKLKLVINIDDTGDGIAPKVAQTLFEPFQSTDKTQGTGLGLYLSQQIARLMDGEITFESQQDVGSSFQATLILEQSSRKEIGKSLKNANIMMFANRDEFIEKVSKEFMNLNVTFQNHDVVKGDITSSLVQMVASGRFYDIAIFDVDIFKHHTTAIAGTLKAISPNIKLVALAGEENDKNLSQFDKVINKPVPYQRFIKYTEEIYANAFFENQNEVDYSQLEILLVEDVELNLAYEEEMLNNFFSISCDTAKNGALAVEKVKSRDYDAILMDMRMPVMNGLEATRKIREFNQTTPIICMSANVYKEDKLAAEESGMNDFIEKPLDKADIESKLLKLINHEFDRKQMGEVKKKRKIEKGVSLDNGLALKEMAFAHLQNNFNNEIATKLFNKAIVSIKGYVQRIKESTKEKDIKALIEDFHALKGVLSNVGIQEFAHEAGELQKIAENGDFMTIVKSQHKLLNNIQKLLDVSKEKA